MDDPFSKKKLSCIRLLTVQKVQQRIVKCIEFIFIMTQDQSHLLHRQQIIGGCRAIIAGIFIHFTLGSIFEYFFRISLIINF